MAMKTVLKPAAFGRLCVETCTKPNRKRPMLPAAFGRLCVETEAVLAELRSFAFQPPSGGCVLKPFQPFVHVFPAMPAAFGRLCVETG